MVCQSPLRGHHAAVLGASGGRAAGHHPDRLHRGAGWRPSSSTLGSGELFAAAQADHHLRSLFARPGRGHEAGWASRASTSGGWATSAKGSVTEDPGPDLASYPLSQVPDEAAPIVRALLTADRNQRFARSRMSEAQRAATPEIDYRPFIIADADTGHGGDAHVRNLVRRFVEVGVPGYHIEDQKPGAKKCGHQGGKVLVGRGRADQAPERRALPARRHEGARHHRGPHRRRGGHVPRRARGRARSAVHPGRHQRRAADLQGRLPRHPEEAPRAGRRRRARSSAVRDLRGRVRRGQRLARAGGRDARARGRARRRSSRPTGRRSRRCSTGSRRATWRRGRPRPT